MIYFVFLCISLVSLMAMKKTKMVFGGLSATVKFGELITICLFTLLTAARAFSVGTDTLNYVHSANSIQRDYSSLLSIFNGYYIEPGYGALEYICMKWLGDVHFIFLIEGLVLLIGVFSFIHNFEGKVSIPLSFLVFFSFYFSSSLNISRQYLSVGIGLFAAKYLLENKKIPYFVCCAIASLFHSTGLLLFFSYFVWIYLFNSERKASFTKKVLVITIGMMILCILIRPITMLLISLGLIPAKYINFLHDSEATSTFSYIILSNAPLLLLLAFLKKRLLEYDERNRIVITLYLMGFYVSMLNAVFGNVGRLAVFWSSWQIILYPECCELLCLNQKSPAVRVVTRTLFVLFFVAYWYYCTIYREFCDVSPYKSDVFGWMNW